MKFGQMSRTLSKNPAPIQSSPPAIIIIIIIIIIKRSREYFKI